MGLLLPQSFYARDALEVAEDLLGHHIHHGEVVLRITEVEAYRHPHDSASHCRMGQTPRNAPMWGPAGHAYVYLCYGVHHMLNFVTNREREGAAVLIRACEVVHGADLVAARRASRRGSQSAKPHKSDKPHKSALLAAGPGNVCAALAVDRSFSGESLFHKGGLEVRRGSRPNHVVRGPRIGISYASEEHQAAPWRFAIAESLAVTHRKLLPDSP